MNKILLVDTSSKILRLKSLPDQAYFEEELNRQMSELMLKRIQQFAALNDFDGFAVVKGPGSFTGLRIGHSVLNAVAYSLNKPITSLSLDQFERADLKELQSLFKTKIFKDVAVPEYGQDFIPTPPRK